MLGKKQPAEVMLINCSAPNGIVKLGTESKNGNRQLLLQVVPE
jgi:hypothetical protein